MSGANDMMARGTDAACEQALHRLGLLPESPAGVLPQASAESRLEDFPARYRALCGELAVARERQVDVARIERLEVLVAAGHRALYAARRPAWSAVGDFLARRLPRAVRAEWRMVLAALALLFLPLLIALGALQLNPQLVYLLLGGEELTRFERMYSPDAQLVGWGGQAGSQWMMYGYYIANNVGIDFQCFAGGLLFGAGAVFYMVFNGLMIGAVAGHLTQVGLGEPFWGFVAGHSAPELLGAALAGAAGLKLGGALLAPGRWPRGTALAQAARAAAPLLVGATTLTFGAAFIEAFWSSNRGLPFALTLGVGLALWAVIPAWLAFGGRDGR